MEEFAWKSLEGLFVHTEVYDSLERLFALETFQIEKFGLHTFGLQN